MLARGTFVGREPKLDQFWSQLSATLRGRAGLLLVNGEAGIGKTRLLRECANIATRVGMRVVRGRALEDSATPYLLFMNVFDLYAGELPSPLMPNAHAESLDVSTQRMRFFAAFIRQIIQLAQREPLLLVLDDLHWADAASLELLAHLVFSLAEDSQRVPIMILAGHRPEARDPRFQSWLSRLQRESIVHALELHEFEPAETDRLLESLGHPRADHTLFAVVHVIHAHNRIIRQQLLAYTGREVTHTGDGVMAEFRSAAAAMRCAVAIQHEFIGHCRQHPETPIRVRIGLNAGRFH